MHRNRQQAITADEALEEHERSLAGDPGDGQEVFVETETVDPELIAMLNLQRTMAALDAMLTPPDEPSSEDETARIRQRVVAWFTDRYRTQS